MQKMQQMQAQQRGLDPRMAAGDPRRAAVDPRMAAVEPRMAAHFSVPNLMLGWPADQVGPWPASPPSRLTSWLAAVGQSAQLAGRLG